MDLSDAVLIHGVLSTRRIERVGVLLDHEGVVVVFLFQAFVLEEVRCLFVYPITPPLSPVLVNALGYQLLDLNLVVEAGDDLVIVAILVTLVELDDVAVSASAKLYIFLLSNIPLLYLHHFFKSCELHHVIGGVLTLVRGSARLLLELTLGFLEAFLRKITNSPLLLYILIKLSQILRIRIYDLSPVLFDDCIGSGFFEGWGSLLCHSSLRLLLNLLDCRCI